MPKQFSLSAMALLLRLFCGGALLLFAPSALPTVLFYEIVPGVYEVVIHGEITSPDFNYLVERVKALKPVKERGKSVVFYKVNSHGGDVRTAMRIGAFLRAREASVDLARDAQCASACVFVLAGAVKRNVQGKVAIHRPFNPADTDTSPASQRATYKQLESEIKKYLSDMNVSPTLYDDMLYISPDSVRVLSNAELSRYGLSGWDPYYEQSYNAKQAIELGISARTLTQRNARAYSECGDITDTMSPNTKIRVLNCHDDVLKGKR